MDNNKLNMRKILLVSAFVFGVFGGSVDASVLSRLSFIGRMVAENVVVVNRIEDLPKVSDTSDGLGVAYRLESGKNYFFGKDLSLGYPVVMNNNTLTGFWASEISYTGTGSFLRNNTTTTIGLSRIIGMRFEGDYTNNFADIDGGIGLTIDHSFIANFAGSTILTGVCYVRNVTIEEQLGAFVWDSSSVLYMNGILQYTSSTIGGSLNQILASSATIDIQNIAITPLDGDSAFWVDPNYTGRMNIGGGGVTTSLGGTFFGEETLTERSPNIEVLDVYGSPNSQEIGSLYMERNATVTNITAVGETGAITAFSDAGGGIVTVATVGHGLLDGATVWIIDDFYTGKYVIFDKTTDTFNITATFNGTGTGKWETNWVKVAGTTFAMENERASMTNYNELTFTNIESFLGIVDLSTNPRNNSVSAVKDWEFAVMKNNKRLKGCLKYRQMTNKAGEGNTMCTTSVVAGDVFEVFVRNILDTEDMVMENMSLIIK